MKKKVAGRWRFYAFVDARIEPDDPDEKPRARETLLLDAIDADAFDRGPEALELSENLALIRVLSTRRRLREDFDLPAVNESDWLELTVAVDPGSPRAWVMPATNNYDSERSENIRAIARLPVDGSAGGPAADVARRLRSECQLPEKRYAARPDDFALTLLQTSDTGLEIRAVDVGQASCTVFLYEGKPIGYFDVGAPLYRNQKSYGGHLCHVPPRSGFVILSHWDFDHFDLARRRPALQNLNWFAPDQPVGPNTLKFQKSLGSNLKFLNGPTTLAHFDLRPGLASNPNDRNGTGYSLGLILGPDKVVLTGDASYQHIDPVLLSGASRITIPHHGGFGAGPIPAATGVAKAVASYGNPNCYRHPDEEFLRSHGVAGWNVQRTAKHASNRRRGFVQLFP